MPEHVFKRFRFGSIHCTPRVSALFASGLTCDEVHSISWVPTEVVGLGEVASAHVLLVVLAVNAQFGCAGRWFWLGLGLGVGHGFLRGWLFLHSGVQGFPADVNQQNKAHNAHGIGGAFVRATGHAKPKAEHQGRGQIQNCKEPGVIDAEIHEAVRGVVADPLFSVACFLMGTLFGHRFAYWRDRVKDLNGVAVAWRAFLMAEASAPCAGRPRPEAITMDGVLARVGWLRRARIKAAWQRYCNECNAQTRYNVLNEVGYKDTAAVARAASQCLRLIKIF
jgi:hypothetical protein